MMPLKSKKGKSFYNIGHRDSTSKEIRVLTERSVMRKIAILILFTLFSLNSIAKEENTAMICSALNYKKVKAKVEAEGSYDKFKHCAVSCLLALRCPTVEVMQLGILKELADIFGPGNAEWDDLKADADGVNLVTSKKAKTDKECFQGCHGLHPRSSACAL